MKNNSLSDERKLYLKKLKREKFLVALTQILLLVGLIALWEISIALLPVNQVEY